MMVDVKDAADTHKKPDDKVKDTSKKIPQKKKETGGFKKILFLEVK